MENLNLKDTWIDRTKEVDKYFQERYGLKNCTNGFYYYDEDGFHLGYFESQKANRKQIHLVDGEFHYVEEEMSELEEMKDEKIEDSFNKFGFETPEFMGEIFKEGNILKEQKVYLGVIKNGYEDLLVYFNEDGKCHQGNGYFLEDYNLTPLKKNWWEKEENIGKLIRYDYFQTYELGIFLGVNKDKDWLNIATLQGATWKQKVRKCKLATPEECLSLCIKE